MTLTLKQQVKAVIAHEEIRPVPYSVAIEEDVSDRLDQHYGNKDWREKLTPYIVGVGAVDTNLKRPLDETHVQDAYGGIWRIDQRPWHLEKPPLAEAAWGDYQFPKVEDFLRPDWKADAFKICAEKKDSFIVGHLGWGLFERSWNLRGFENALMDAALDEDFFVEMVTRIKNLYLQFVDYTCDLPIDGILFGDDWGDQRGVIIGADRWRRLLKPYWAEIFAAVHKHGKITMCHSCGSIAEIYPDLIEIGLDVHESVQPEAAHMNPYELKKKFGKNLSFWGCVGSQSTIPHATAGELAAEVRKLCAEMGKGGGYILAPAKPLQPETPTANAVALIESFTQQS